MEEKDLKIQDNFNTDDIISISDGVFENIESVEDFDIENAEEVEDNANENK